MKTLPPSKFSKALRGFQKLAKWPLRILAVFLMGMIGLIIMVFNPGLLYAHATEVEGWEILHESPLQPEWAVRIQEAQTLIAKSEIYDPHWPLQVCLRDGSNFPGLMETLRGDAFAYGYSNKIVFLATTDAAANRADLRGYQMHLSQLMAHEAVHCLQYHDLGLLGSNPIAGIPNWKWEGYPEYIARKGTDLGSLHQQIDQWLAFSATTHDGWIKLPDGSGVADVLYQARLWVTYCMEIEGQTWRELVADGRTESEIEASMLRWHEVAAM